MPSATRVIVFCSLTCLATTVAAAEPQIRLVGDPKKPTAIEIVGLPQPELARFDALLPDDARWADAFAIYVADAADAQPSQAIAGSYAVADTALRFTPRYSLRPGLTYRVVYRPLNSQPAALGISRQISIPAPPPAEPTRVVAIYPSASALPENQLRFYLHFSAPMAAGDAYAHVKLLKADGTEVKRAFLEIGEELWDGAGQRLTLLFDPGRVKKGLMPRELFGPVLEPGQSYRLVIDKAWRDANGNSLASGFEKSFRALPAVETAVDAKQWKIAPPPALTREPLVISFPRPLDRALLARMIDVQIANQKYVDGEISLHDDERRFEFRPSAPWQAGQHELVVDTTLEDSAGNNLARPFEVDVFDRVDKTSAPELMRIPFVIKAK